MEDIVTKSDGTYLEIGVVKLALESFRGVLRNEAGFGSDTSQGTFIAGALRGLELLEMTLDGILAAPVDEKTGDIDLDPIIAAYENHTRGTGKED